MTPPLELGGNMYHGKLTTIVSDIGGAAGAD